MKFKALCLSFLVLASAPAFADNVVGGSIKASPGSDTVLVSGLKVQKVTGKPGQETLVATDSVKPGEVLQYSLTYQNKSTSSLKKVEFVLPIPKETEYTPTAGMSALELASLDGQTFETVPLKRKVKTAEGKEVAQDVPPVEYRFLKWTKAEMPAGDKLTFHARVTAKK